MTVLGWGKDPYGAVAGWYGNGAVVSVPDVDGIVTVTGLGNMSPLSVGRALSFYGVGFDPAIIGTFPIVEYVSASSVKILNPNGSGDSGLDWIERLQTQESIYGAGSKGLGTSIVAAVALSTHEVQVTLSGEPLHSSNFVVGDALNPATWSVQNLGTLAFLHVVSVRPYSPTSYGLLTLEEFGDVTVLHQASSATLRSPDGQVLHAPRAADFYGLLDENEASPAARLAKQRVTSRDIQNAQASTTLQSGTLIVEGDGDYATVSGAALVKKLILRRLMSRPGDFFHLPQYGIGLREKEPIPAGNLGKLQKEITRQVLLEPEVADAVVGLTLASDGTLTVRVNASLRVTGQVVAFDVPLGQQGGVQL